MSHCIASAAKTGLMTKANFYNLAGRTRHDQWLFVCQLCEQLHQKKRQILVQCASEKEAVEFDRMLWEFSPDSFVPHALLNAEDAPADCPVSIGWQDDAGHHHDVMINLCPELPVFFSRFQGFAEVIIQEDSVLQYTRTHFKFLKDRGYPLEYHDRRMS